MKVLLCTPYNLQNTKPGGISIWARNIIEYNQENPENVSIDIYKCNRSSFITEDTNKFKRIFLGVFDYFRFIIGIFNKVQKKRHQVVHINTTASYGAIKDIIICLLLKLYNTRVYLHYHFGRIPEFCKERNLGWYLVKLSLKCTHRAILMDKQSYDVLKNEGFKNIVEIPNPYSLNFEKKVDILRNSVSRVPNRILFLGRVSKKKGIYELVEACKTFKNIELRIVGGYDQIDKEKLLNIANHGEWIKFIGPLHNDDVIKELLACEFLVMPTYTEGFPNVVLEAMVAKTPIIVTPVGAIPEMLNFDNDPCGISIKPKNINDIVDGINKLLGNDKLQKTLTTKAFERVKSIYNLNTVGEMLYSTWRN